MASILYFAYGSNMLAERLHARCRSARFRGTARAEGFALSFAKRSRDGSGKATLAASNAPAACVHGVVFDIQESDIDELDRLEGLGRGYNRDNAFNVVEEPHRLLLSVATYIADPESVDPTLKPYDWYLRLVIEGARQHRLPPQYIEALGATPTTEDPKPNRKSRVEALALLAQTGAT
jgi:gamma-glutamylcyclotransferase (GGCT)/AIG2-like uncharacterized protein YtfP